MNRPSILVLGIGNVLCGDDGIGCRVAEYLYARHEFPENVQILDGGTLSSELLEPIIKTDKLLVIDCVDFGLLPGSLAFANGNELPMWIGAKKLSPHQASFAEILALASLKNGLPEEIQLIGIQPQSIEFGHKLSQLVSSKLEALARQCLLTLASWNIKPTPRKNTEFLNETDLALQYYEPDIALTVPQK